MRDLSVLLVVVAALALHGPSLLVRRCLGVGR